MPIKAAKYQAKTALVLLPMGSTRTPCRVNLTLFSRFERLYYPNQTKGTVMTTRPSVEFFDISKLGSEATTARINALLQERGWSVQKLAKRADMVEADVQSAMDNPGGTTIATFSKIAEGFGFSSMNAFMGEKTVVIGGVADDAPEAGGPEPRA